jgi:hypothetical protein
MYAGFVECLEARFTRPLATSVCGAEQEGDDWRWPFTTVESAASGLIVDSRSST